MRHGIGIVVLTALFECGSAQDLGRDRAIHPVHVGPGPLVFFTRPEDRDGKPMAGGDCDGGRLEAIYVCDPQLDEPPQLFWRAQKRGRLLRPIARPKRNIAVMEDSRAWIVELDSGRATPMLESSRNCSVIDVVDGSIYFSDDEVPSDLSGYSIDDDGDGHEVVRGYCKTRSALFVRDATPSAKARRLADVAIERLLTTEPNGFWVVTVGPMRKLARLGRDGALHELIDFDPHWVTPETYLSFSPDRRFVAVALLHDQHDFFDERELLVIDIAARRVVMSRERISLERRRGQDEPDNGAVQLPRAFDNAVPQLHVRWLDSKTLEFGAFVLRSTVVDVESGRVVDESRATELRGPRPSGLLWEIRVRHGAFETTLGSLFFSGADEPIPASLSTSSVQSPWMSNVAIDCEGLWAAYSSSVDGTYLIDGTHKHERLLLPGWSYGVAWLPATSD